MTAPGLALLVTALGEPSASPRDPAALLPRRIRRIVLHVPGGPDYARPERRWTFFPPQETQALWRSRSGAHWIVWSDGSLWPRHVGAGESPSYRPPADRPADTAWRQRIAREAAPVYAHLHLGNSHSVGIEVSHSGRSGEAFPKAQLRSVAWLVRTLLEMSGGRLTTASVLGHKDLDRRPAYALARCQRPGCPVYVDGEGRPFRRRVDPPESLFAALREEDLAIDRSASAGDADLRRAEAIAPGARPKVGAGGR